MATVEIDEVELQKSTQLKNFVENIRRNPKAWRKLLEAQKEVKPDDPMVKELDSPEPLEELRASHAKEISDLRKEIAEKEAKREQEEKLAGLLKVKTDGISRLKSEGWTDEGIKGIEEIMEKKGVLDPLDAAAIYEKAHPPATPISPTSGVGGWNFMDTSNEDDKNLKALLETRGNSEALADKMAMDALQDFRRSVGQARR